MISLKQIRQDLREIRYYYSKQNEAMKRAPIKLYDVYISLYINNNTQEALAFDWDVCCEYIRKLNKSLCEFLQRQLA